MIAIPLDSKDATIISKLYGKAPFFALLDSENGNFTVISNEKIGQGPKIAEFLKDKEATSTIFYHMGEGVYKAFAKENLDVYTAKHSSESIDSIYQDYLKGDLKNVNATNYKEELDPGESGSCNCGCEH